MKNYALLLILCLPLPGCVLSSQVSAFGDEASVLLLGDTERAVELYVLKDGVWVAAETPALTLRSEGRHYVAPDPETPLDPAKAFKLYFLDLGGGRYIIQMVESGGIGYAVATWDGTELLADTLECSDLREIPGVERLVTFDAYDCSLRPSSDRPLDVFAALAAPSVRPYIKAEIRAVLK